MLGKLMLKCINKKRIEDGSYLFNTVLDEIIQVQKLYGENINQGISKEEATTFEQQVQEEFHVVLPKEYLQVLEIVNGIEFNGFILYGVGQVIFNKPVNQQIYDFIEYNKLWYENKWQKQYILLGESNISWYVYELKMNKYLELDNPSGSEMEKFNDLDQLLEKMLSDSLM